MANPLLGDITEHGKYCTDPVINLQFQITELFNI